MDRLKRPRFSAATFVRIVVLIIALGLAVFLYFRSARVNEPSSGQIQNYLKTRELIVASEVTGDFQQVYFLFDSQRISITSGQANHANPVASGQYIVWTETPYQQNSSLIMLYDVLTKTKTQLTFGGTSLRPTLEGNRVVWEDWSGTTVQIHYYDGIKARQISQAYPSVHPVIKGKQIAYAQELSLNNWQTVVYNTDTQESQIIATGSQPEAGWPRFMGDRITTNNPN